MLPAASKRIANPVPAKALRRFISLTRKAASTFGHLIEGILYFSHWEYSQVRAVMLADANTQRGRHAFHGPASKATSIRQSNQLHGQKAYGP